MWEPDTRLSPARVLRLINNLPDGCLTKAMYAGGDEYLQWDRHASILADLFDAVQVNTHTLVMANTDKKHKNDVKDPELYPRPGQDKKPKQKGNNMFAAMAKAQLNRGG